ncbi:MAG: sigma-70 family RNA polymerase sigma factor [Gammaproteobacteria bacterium]|nr:sigma-70 family RNA polymerase sigma factor [Gammaproteobacteria bacterium]
MATDVTTLLNAHRNGDASALNQLADLLYPELKAMARNRSRSGAGLGATTLVNETFLKLLSGGELRTDDRRQFFALMATIMRQIIVDEIRYVTADKRARRDVTFVDTVMGDDAHEKAELLLQVDEALNVVAAQDEQLAVVFECRYFAGMTTAETAEALSVSPRTAERLWAEARARVGELIDDRTE